MVEDTATSSADPALVTAMKSMKVRMMALVITLQALKAAGGRGGCGAPVDVV